MSQHRRLVTLKQAFQENIWMDSKYAFGVLHAHRTIWKERGLLSAQGTSIKHGTQTLHLLEAVQKPAEVATRHCRTHQTNKMWKWAKLWKLLG